MVLSSLVFVFVFVFIWLVPPCYSQNFQTNQPVNNAPMAAPLPGFQSVPNNFNSGNQGNNSGASAAYRRLPISVQAAALRLEELRNLMPNSRSKEFQDAVGDYLEWLSDMADSHWRIYQSFSKVDGMKAQAEQEKQTTLKLGQLKRQCMLLKAEFLIRENRQPEALAPLVEIVVAEPKTELGKSAYSLLKGIGFSEDIAAVAPVSGGGDAQTTAVEPSEAPAVAVTSAVASKSKAVAIQSRTKSAARH